MSYIASAHTYTLLCSTPFRRVGKNAGESMRKSEGSGGANENLQKNTLGEKCRHYAGSICTELRPGREAA